MSAYKNDLHINSHESGARLALAQELLNLAQGVVVIDDSLALRPTQEAVLCEVIVTSPKQDYSSYIAAAKDLLACSTLSRWAQSKNLQWLVVDDYGTGTVELWRAS
jgi:hypothetical protein